PRRCRGPGRGAVENRVRVGRKVPGGDRLPRAPDEPLHVVQVVEGQQPGPSQVLVASEVVEVGTRVPPARFAGAPLDDRGIVRPVGALGQVDPEASLGSGRKRGAVTGEPTRARTVEGGSGY